MTSVFASCMNYKANQALFDIAFDADVLHTLLHPADRSHIEKLVSDVGMSFIHKKGLMISRMRVVCVAFFVSFLTLHASHIVSFPCGIESRSMATTDT